MKIFSIDTKKKKINYNLKFKYKGEEINENINLKELDKEGSLFVSGPNTDYIITLELLKSGVLGLKVETVFDEYICTFQLTELDIKWIHQEN